MKSFEQMHNQENAIVEGVIKPQNRGEVQMILATKLSEYLFGIVESHNAAMDYWVGDDPHEGYSAKFAQLEKDPIFINHSRLKGDITKITVEDMLKYAESLSLPE